MTDPRLDRLVEFDERSRDFPVRALLRAPAEAFPPRSYTWRCDVWLDQRSEGACTGFATAHEAAARPVKVPVTEAVAREVYRRARQLDQWPGEDYSGSSVIAAVKAGQERGWYGEYRWAFGLEDLKLAVGYRGPAILGVNWYSGMFSTDRDGFVHATGSVEGGHAVLCHSVNVPGRFFKLHNSWGQDWGVAGEARISWEDLDKLLREDGEACVPVKRSGR